MANAEMNPKVDEFLERTEKWRAEFEKLRAIILDCGLTEELKWGQPCYTLDKKNVVLIHGFKEYCAILFIKGSLLQDPNGVLIQQTENVQAGRQIRFTGVQQVVEMEAILKVYIQQAIAVEKAGLEVEFKPSTQYAPPDELLKRFEELPALRTAFEALTPGRQRAYLLHFSAPKQSKTREARIEKCMEQIFSGKGLND